MSMYFKLSIVISSFFMSANSITFPNRFRAPRVTSIACTDHSASTSKNFKGVQRLSGFIPSSNCRWEKSSNAVFRLVQQLIYHKIVVK